jgi:hypothetical protein
MATNIGFVLSALIAVGIIFIGGAFSRHRHWRQRDMACQPAPSRIRGRTSLRKVFVTSRRACSPLFPLPTGPHTRLVGLCWSPLLYLSVMLRSSYTRGQQSGSLRHPRRHGRCNADHQWLAAVQLTNFKRSRTPVRLGQ